MLAFELGMIRALWWRDLLRLWRERSRWVGVVVHPLLVWVVIGYGIDTSFGATQGSSYLHYFFPGIIVMSMLFTTIYATMEIIEDRASGFLQAVLVAPGSHASLILGKSLGVTSIGLIQTVIFLALAPWAEFTYSNMAWGSIILIMSVSLMAFTAMNFSFAWILNSTQGYHAIMNVLLIPAWMFSGAIFPQGPAWLTTLMRFNPLYYVVEALRQSMEGQSFLTYSVILPLGILICFGLVMFFLATMIVHRTQVIHS